MTGPSRPGSASARVGACAVCQVDPPSQVVVGLAVCDDCAADYTAYTGDDTRPSMSNGRRPGKGARIPLEAA